MRTIVWSANRCVWETACSGRPGPRPPSSAIWRDLIALPSRLCNGAESHRTERAREASQHAAEVRERGEPCEQSCRSYADRQVFIDLPPEVATPVASDDGNGSSR